MKRRQVSTRRRNRPKSVLRLLELEHSKSAVLSQYSVLLNARRGSDQYQSTNSSIA